MKSKAQQYVEILNSNKQPRCIVNGKVIADVTCDGKGELTGGQYTTDVLLTLRDWLTDTFDVPKIPGRQPGWSRED